MGGISFVATGAHHCLEREGQLGARSVRELLDPTYASFERIRRHSTRGRFLLLASSSSSHYINR